MNSKERLEVSERMKKYWESRRKTGTDDRKSSDGRSRDDLFQFTQS